MELKRDTPLTWVPATGPEAEGFRQDSVPLLAYSLYPPSGYNGLRRAEDDTRARYYRQAMEALIDSAFDEPRQEGAEVTMPPVLDR
ncbi:hypothetical protein [Paracoccus sulfuroxidans]|uniref:Uncharacterized protein n=1 Tax=Paracoccus sulfuroxidans TaxID=384678 RepID=A0A562NL76_9RHOB|nr:hypothetical protein [Paracoccus sulfuroxidans]TWI32962.1 hypothetical protein IQ24_02844 [Paracoccus sulfuroxidans]